MVAIFKYLFHSKFLGLVIYPFLFLKYKTLKNDTFLINHERIYLQQKEACQNESNLNYLLDRKKSSFINYFK